MTTTKTIACVALGLLGLTLTAAAALADDPGPAETSAPFAEPVTFVHHPHSWRLEASPLPSWPGAWELRLVDLPARAVPGAGPEVPVTDATLELGGVPAMTFVPLRGGARYALIPPGSLAPGSDPRVRVFSGADAVGSIGLAGLLL